MQKKWQIAGKIQEELAKDSLGINPIILQVLYNRGIRDKEKIIKFFNPCYSSDLYDPFLFRDMGKAVERIFSALGNGEKITIYGDYDADGVTATALLEKLLRELGAMREGRDCKEGEEGETRIKNQELRIKNGKLGEEGENKISNFKFQISNKSQILNDKFKNREGGEEKGKTKGQKLEIGKLEIGELEKEGKDGKEAKEGVNQKSAIENLKSKIDIYIPHRGREGYGLNKEALKYIKDNGSSLVITVDCGVSNSEEVDYGNSLGLDIIITDHHQPPEKLPNAYAVLNPKVASDNYPFRQLAGVGVAFKLAQGLLAELRIKEGKDGEQNEKWMMDLAAIGTIADCCPLIDENRALVKYGLIVLNKTKNIGLQALIETAIAKGHNNSVRCFNQNGRYNTGESGGDKEKLGIVNLKLNIDAWNVAFQIAPRINAAGRLDHANTAYRLLTTTNEEEAQKIAYILDETNSKRQIITDKAVKEAIENIEKEQKDKKVFFVYEKHWEPGILGLIAGKICERYYKPVFVFTKIGDEIVASGRSIPEFNMIEALREIENEGREGETRIKNQELRIKKGEEEEEGEEEIKNRKFLKRYGGHAQACGVSLVDEKSFEEFREKFLQLAQEKLKDIELVPKLNIDATASIMDISWELVDNLKLMEPFGEGNQKPLFEFKNLEILEVRIIGNGGKHLKMKLFSRKKKNNKLEIKKGETRIKNQELRIKKGEENRRDGALPRLREGKEGGEGREGEELEIRPSNTVGKNWELGKGGQGVTINAVGFSMNDEDRLWGEKLKAGDVIDAAGYIDVNEWNGKREIQIKLCDLILVKKNDK
ncbi:MAG: DHH family phosphoesterase [bacterium]